MSGLLWFILGHTPEVVAQQAIFYVSPTGNDANPGTEGQPLLTIDRARSVIRAINASMSGDIIVYLRGGQYQLADTVTFDGADSGTNGFTVVYRAYPGEEPVLSGGRTIAGWIPVGDGSYRAPVGALRFRQLFVNGIRATRARTPNAGSYFQVRSWDAGAKRIEIAASEIAIWQQLNRVEMVVLGRGVNQANLRIGSYTISGTSAFITPLEPERTRIFEQVYPPKESRPYYLENAREFLDLEGEWYLDTQSNEVFYRPRAGEDMTTALAVAPVLETLVALRGTLAAPVHHIQFYGLTFEYSTWLVPDGEGFIGDQASIVFTQALPVDQITSYPGHRLPAGVHLEAADHTRWERNIFRHMGASALNLYVATSDNVVVGNVVTDVSGSGISVDLNLEGNPTDPRKVSRRNTIRNNHISRIGQDYFQSVGIMAGYTDATVIEHNELTDMPYSGISVGWGWADQGTTARDNLVRFNNISSTNVLMADGAGIYTLSRQPGTHLFENYIHDIVRHPWLGGYEINGIFLDEGSNFITVENNVFENIDDADIRLNAAGNNNVFINNGSSSATVIANSGLEPAYQDIRPSSPPETFPPTVTIVAPTASPTYSAASTPLTLAGAAGDNIGVTQVTWANNRGGSGTASGTTTWTASGIALQAGTNVLTVTARDAAGNVGAATLSVTYDPLAPTVSITVPTTGATHATNSSPLALGGTAADNLGVTQVTWVNSAGGAGTASGTASWSAPGITLQSGTNVLTVTARDAAGNTGTATLTVTYDGTATAPTVSITAPAAGATVSGTTTVSATAADTVGVVGVQFLLDGVALGAEQAGPVFSVSWNTTTTVNGAHTLSARARNAAGNTALSTNVPVTVANTTQPAGLVAAYAFNEGSGSTTADATGNNHTGAITGAVWTTQGRFGNALTFDGVNDWVTVASTSLLSLTTGMTLQAWVFPTALGANWRNVIIKERPGGEVYNLYANVETSVPVVYVVRASAPSVPEGLGGVTQVPLNTWSHLAATYNGATLRLFVNGIEVANRALTGPLVTSTGVLRIGGNSLWGEFFQGRIDEIRIYNRALTATEIQGDMNTPVGGSPLPDTTPPVRSNGLPTGTVAAGTTQTAISLATNENATCRYATTAGVAYASMTTTFTTTGATAHSTTVTGLANGGSYSFVVRCQDTAGNPNTNDFTIGFSVAQPADTTPPVRSNGLPTGTLAAGTTQTTISLATNENATCRYATTAGVAYASMTTTFTTTGTTAHSTTVTGLTNGGSYSFFVRCRDTAANPNTNDFTISFSIAAADTTPPVRSNGQPTGTLPAGTTQATLSLTTNESATCRYATTAGVVYGSMTSTFGTTGASAHSTPVTGLTSGGSYSFFVRCQDAASNANPNDFTISFSVAAADTTPPVRSNGQPTGTLPAGTTQTTLSLTTNENATCRYATTAGVVYGSMTSTFSTTGATAHSTSVTGLTNGGSYSFFVRCQDAASNASPNDFTISFSVAASADVGLVAAYSFNEGAGSSVADASGNSHTGIVTGATRTTAGRFGNALSFDGVNDWVTVADSNLLDLTTGMTLSAWVFPTAQSSALRNVLMKERAGGEVYSLYSNASSRVPRVYVVRSAAPSTPLDARGTAQLPLNTWTHLAATFDGATLRLYVNGVQVGSRAVAAPLLTSTGALRIGGNNVRGEFFKGRIDEVRIYNRALTQSEIQTDMTRPITP